jgi:hypothetical protein
VNKSNPPEPEGELSSEDEDERLRAELFAGFAALIEKGVDVDQLRDALQKSFMISASAEQRKGYDALRIEIDAYLRSLGEGEAVIRALDGFVESPELPEEAAELLGGGRRGGGETSH